jgi:hypothetical protein
MNNTIHIREMDNPHFCKLCVRRSKKHIRRPKWVPMDRYPSMKTKLATGYCDRRRPALVKLNRLFATTNQKHTNPNQNNQEENLFFIGLHRCCAHVISDLRSSMRIEKWTWHCFDQCRTRFHFAEKTRGQAVRAPIFSACIWPVCALACKASCVNFKL